MPNPVVIALFVLLLASLGLLIKWEYRRAKRSSPPMSKDLQRQVLEPDGAGHTYVAPPDRTNRAFQIKSERH